MAFNFGAGPNHRLNLLKYLHFLALPASPLAFVPTKSIDVHLLDTQTHSIDKHIDIYFITLCVCWRLKPQDWVLCLLSYMFSQIHLSHSPLSQTLCSPRISLSDSFRELREWIIKKTGASTITVHFPKKYSVLNFQNASFHKNITVRSYALQKGPFQYRDLLIKPYFLLPVP